MAGGDTNVSTLQHFIDGERVAGESNRFGDVYNPATGKVQARVPFATAGEVDTAVQAAKAAFPAWSATPPSQRARILFRYRDLVEAHRDELARICSSEHGKTLDDARGSVTRGIEIVEFACGIPAASQGRVQRERRGPCRQLQRAPAGGRVRRNHPVQFPGHGPDVDVSDCPRLRQHLRAEAVGEGPVVRTCGWPSLQSRPAYRLAC